MANKLAKVFGIIFILVGLLGFVGNPLVSDTGLFHTDTVHNLVHLISGIVLLWAAAKGAAGGWLKIIGIIYLLVAVLGFVGLGSDGMGWVLGFLSVNAADNWLHLLLGLIFVLGGFSGKKSMGAPIASSMPGQM